MRRIKTVVSLVLALVWVPAVSCCLLDASGLLDKRDCCSKEQSHCVPSPGDCDQPCGELASANYLSQPGQVIVVPQGAPFFYIADSWVEPLRPGGIGRDLPTTAPPELAGHWQFTFRTALAPRAPSFVS